METMSVETIKPSSPTPHSLRTLHLSLVDYIVHPVYTSACLFYRNYPSIPRDETTKKLKTSLSETLAKFYPFSGRINGVTVDCNDEGAIFIQATLDNSTLSGFLRSPDSKAIQQTLLPLVSMDKQDEDVITWPLLLVKITYFQCGGMSIGICIAHNLADAASLSIFVQTWAATTRGESGTVGKTEFAGTMLYPPANEAFQKPEKQTGKRKSITKRFVFSGPKIEELRSKISVVPRPTRVTIVSALLWRCVVAASNTKKTCTKVLHQPANLRSKIPSLLSENLIGNLIHSSMTINRKCEIEIQETVEELRERAEEMTSLIQDGDGSATTLGSKLLGVMLNDYSKLCNDPDHELYAVSSWCKMPFYNANFGTGSPVWVVGNVAPIVDFMTVLLDSNDFEGIEAWVTLAEQDMASFEQNPELLAFASLNPTVLF